jgi:hypothetical protein
VRGWVLMSSGFSTIPGIKRRNSENRDSRKARFHDYLEEILQCRYRTESMYLNVEESSQGVF